MFIANNVVILLAIPWSLYYNIYNIIMIPSKHKITQKDFTNYIRGKHVPFSRGTIIVSNRPKKPGFAVVVSKKVAQKAYQRNIIKRFYYGVLQKHLDFFLENNISIVVLMKTKIQDIKITFSKNQKTLLTHEIEHICLKK